MHTVSLSSAESFFDVLEKICKTMGRANNQVIMGYRSTMECKNKLEEMRGIYFERGGTTRVLVVLRWMCGEQEEREGCGLYNRHCFCQHV